MFRRKRHFIVVHFGTSGDGDEHRGYSGVTSYTFVNAKKQQEYLKKEHKMDQAVITNIMEVSKKDYLEFFK